MTKFNDKSTSHFPLAFFFSAMQAFDMRIGAINTQLERLISMRTQLNGLYQAFDTAYTQSRKSQLTKKVGDLDKQRDNYAWVMEHVAALWAEKLDEDELNIHGRRIGQVFKDYDFRTTEALVAENAKIDNMQQRFAEETLAADLEAMGLTELNRRLISTTAEIKQIMQLRNEENSAIVTGEVKQKRESLEQAYRQMITYLNAVQELMPEDSISLAAQYYNEDFRKIEQQLAQSRKGGSVSSGSSTNSGSTDSGSTGEGGSSEGSTTDPATGGSSEGSGDNSGGGSDSEGGVPDVNAGFDMG